MADTQEYYDIEKGFIRRKIWSVYLLFDDDKIIYVGCSNNLVQRINSHTKLRQFNSYMIYYQSTNRNNALDMERRIIMLLNFFTDHPLQNKYIGPDRYEKIPLDEY